MGVREVGVWLVELLAAAGATTVSAVASGVAAAAGVQAAVLAAGMGGGGHGGKLCSIFQCVEVTWSYQALL